MDEREQYFADLKQKFLELCKNIYREGMDGFMDWLNKTDFYIAPSSTKYHGAYKHGLLEHSLDVYEELLRLRDAYPEISIPSESLVIVSLFHDICKVNFYTTEKRNRKNDAGQWESYDYYTVEEKFCYGGHGSKSVFILQNFMKLTPDEAVAINCHMGTWSENPKDVANAYEQCGLAWLLHVADEAATYRRDRGGKSHGAT